MNSTKTNKWFLFSMMLIAANLRLPITIIPPLLKSIEKDIGIPSSLAGMLTSIPLITFAIFSPLIVKVAQKKGNELTIFLLFIPLIIGSYLRLIPTVWALFLGTFLVGIGIDSGNVLLPAVIKDHMPTKMPLGTALYTMSMLLVGAIGTALSGFFITKFSLPTTLGLLSVLGLVAVVCWLPNLRSNQKTATEKVAKPHYQTVWKQRLGWLITLFFGLQSLIYYSLMTWMPSFLAVHQVDTIFASNLLTILQLSGLPFSFIVPLLSTKKSGMAILTSILVAGYVLAPLGFLIDSNSAFLLITLAILVGFAQGAAFNMAIFFFTNKTTNPYQTAEVSGMAQSAGYLFAAIGPTFFGFLSHSLNSWGLMLVIIASLAALLSLTGLIIYRHQAIQE